MNFGMFTDFHIRPHMTQAEAFDSFQHQRQPQHLFGFQFSNIHPVQTDFTLHVPFGGRADTHPIPPGP